MAKKVVDESNNSTIMTPAMQAVKASLYDLFPENKIRERPGRAGQTWKFIDGVEYIDRLNEVFGVAWSIQEIKSEIAGTVLRTLVRLTVPDPNNPDRTWIKEAWSSHPLADNRGKAYDPGDVAKSAYTKALVKAGSMLGIGLTQLWGIDPSDYSTDDMAPPPWDGPEQSTPIPNVRVVNPGPHNAAPPAYPPPPGSQNSQPSPFPHLGNPNVGLTSGPGTPATTQIGINVMPPPTPFPKYPGGPPPSGPSTGGIVDFQISAIKGAAFAKNTDPMKLIIDSLGAGAQGIQAVEMLSFDEAVRVLDYIRNTQGGGGF